MCQTDMTNTTAPMSEIRGRYAGSAAMRLLIIRKPRAMNIAEIMNQNKIHFGSRIPSEMCVFAPPNQLNLISVKLN
jgi:hypothetical protein